MTPLNDDEVLKRAKLIFAKANLPDRAWGDLLVVRNPQGRILTALSEIEQEVYLEQARKELLAEKQ